MRREDSFFYLGRILIGARIEGPLSAAKRKTFARSKPYRFRLTGPRPLPVAKRLAHPLTDLCEFDILRFTVPAHGGSKMHFDQGGHSEVQHQLLITLVRGAWPRGFFPRLFRFKQWVRGLMGRRQPWKPPPFWFEEGSPFLARLSTELHDIPHKVTPYFGPVFHSATGNKKLVNAGIKWWAL